ncbi:MAG TPA: hypothetical protein VEK34_12145 [Methylocella sp.]|nr:hypothetical protein [Methylocella sp.]
MAEAKNPLVSEFATRLRDRKLYKCIDVRAEVANVFDPLSKNAPETVGKIDRSCTNINEKLKDLLNEKRLEIPPLLIDEDERSPYRTEKGRSGPTERINVLTDGGSVVDLAERSRIVASLPSFKLFRVYYDCTNEKFLQRSKQIINDEIKTCP